MPVEIREIVIKTEVKDQEKEDSRTLTYEEIDQLRQQILEDCRKMIKKEILAKHSR